MQPANSQVRFSNDHRIIESLKNYPLDFKIDEITLLVLDYCANKSCTEAARPEIRQLWYERFCSDLEKRNLKLIFDYSLNNEMNKEKFCLEIANKIKGIARKQYSFDEYSPRSLARFFNSHEDDLNVFPLIEKLKIHISNHDLWILFKDIIIFNPNVPIQKSDTINLTDLNIDQKAHFLRERMGEERCVNIFAKTLEISCHRNDLRTIPIEMTFFSNLKILNVHNTEVRQIPEIVFGKLINLKKIYLYQNKLIEIPKEIGNLTKLKSLYLDNNNLKKVPSTIGNIITLQILNLNSNNLEKLPFKIFNLINITSLKVYNNYLEEIPENIGNLKNLIYLHLENNHLKSLPNSIVQLILLKHLSMNDNQLQALPKGFDKLINLEELYLNNNVLQDLPEEVGRLPKLNHLKFNKNPLKKLPLTFQCLLNRKCWLDLSIEQVQKLLEKDKKENQD